jgi:hypothetical protein
VQQRSLAIEIMYVSKSQKFGDIAQVDPLECNGQALLWGSTLLVMVNSYARIRSRASVRPFPAYLLHIAAVQVLGNLIIISHLTSTTHLTIFNWDKCFLCAIVFGPGFRDLPCTGVTCSWRCRCRRWNRTFRSCRFSERTFKSRD